jgi:hypothetical protein
MVKKMKKQNNKSTIILLLILLALVSLALIYSSTMKSDPLLQEAPKEDLKDEEDKLPEESLTLEEQERVIEYLNDNISALSPEEEVLGGSFFITSADFIGNDRVIIGYEDGHNYFIAEACFNFVDDSIEIGDFIIVNEEDVDLEELSYIIE